MALLEVDDISVSFGGIIALDGLSFDIEEGQILGLIGPNGAGKTTMFNVLSRIYDPTEGRLRFDGQDLLAVPAHGIAGLGISRTFQNLALFPTMSLLQNTMTGAHHLGKVKFVRAMTRIGAAKEERALATDAFAILRSLDLADLAFRPAAGLPFGPVAPTGASSAADLDSTSLGPVFALGVFDWSTTWRWSSPVSRCTASRRRSRSCGTPNTVPIAATSSTIAAHFHPWPRDLLRCG